MRDSSRNRSHSILAGAKVDDVRRIVENHAVVEMEDWRILPRIDLRMLRAVARYTGYEC